MKLVFSYLIIFSTFFASAQENKPSSYNVLLLETGINHRGAFGLSYQRVIPANERFDIGLGAGVGGNLDWYWFSASVYPQAYFDFSVAYGLSSMKVELGIEPRVLFTGSKLFALTPHLGLKYQGSKKVIYKLKTNVNFFPQCDPGDRLEPGIGVSIGYPF